MFTERLVNAIPFLDKTDIYASYTLCHVVAIVCTMT